MSLQFEADPTVSCEDGTFPFAPVMAAMVSSPALGLLAAGSGASVWTAILIGWLGGSLMLVLVAYALYQFVEGRDRAVPHPVAEVIDLGFRRTVEADLAAWEADLADELSEARAFGNHSA